MYKGIWQFPTGAVEVAVKILFLRGWEGQVPARDTAINGQFKRPHVVQLLQVVIAGEPVSGFIAKIKRSGK